MKELRKIVRQTLKEYITPRDLRSVEDYADELFSDVGVDVEFTKHFLDRANDLRNKTDITTDELKNLYAKTYQRYANQISKLPSGSEAVLTDPESNINVPFVMNWDGKSPDIDLINKTVMRKKDFKSYTPKLQLEDIDAKEVYYDINSIQTLVDGKRNVAFITLPTEYIIDMINDNKLLSKRVPSNPNMAFIIYRPEGYKDAMELFNIAEKYGGFLSANATEKDARRIGQLLNYKESDIDDYIEHNRNLLKNVAEDINVPINVGDEVLGGKFKNKKVTVKDIGKNEKGDITINDKPLLKVRTIQKENINDNKIGKIFWFEYHCDESTSSCDRHLFLHSHQQVTVLSRGKDDHDEFPEEPRTYHIKFSDGLIGDVFEDELMNSPKEFYRPDPPKI